MELINLARYVERSYEEMPTTDGFVQYGEDNLYPQYLLGLYNSSSTHSALCNSIAQLVMGEGFKADNEEAQATLDRWGCTREFRRAILDYKIQGGFALEIQWSGDRSTIRRVRHVPFENIRSGEMDIDERVRHYYHSLDWEHFRNPEYAAERVRGFHVDDKEEHATQLYYFCPFSPGSTYYPKPDYIGSVNYIELDKAISEYHINNIRNGLAPSFSIHFKNGIPAIEERERIRRDIEMQLSGSRNAGKFIITYSDDPERKPDFEPFPVSDVDKQYEFLSSEVTDKIMVGHRVVSPAMFGVKTEGQLGATEELRTASLLFERQVVNPMRAHVCEVLEDLLVAAGVPAKVEIMGRPPFVEEQEEESRFDVQMHKHHTKEDAAKLIAKAKKPPKGYRLVDKRAVDYGLDGKINDHLNGITFLSGEDTPLILVRYTYEGGTRSNTREFCLDLVSAGGEYSKDDIESMDNNIGGSVWLYKGGPNCHHHWERLTYLREDQSELSESELKRFLDTLDGSEARANDPGDDPWQVATKPIDMPNRGYR